MARIRIPDGITGNHIRAAVTDINAGVPHDFGASTDYDVIIDNKLYPPKAVIGLAAGHATGVALGVTDFSSGKRSRCFDILRENGFRIVDKHGVDIDTGESRDLDAALENEIQDYYVIGQQYSREDVYEVLEVPEQSRGGDWLNGYHRHDDDYYVFANIGTAGRTGHDYDNHWDDETFVWFGKSASHFEQDTIKRLVSGEHRVFIFYRKNDRDPFTFAGLGSPAPHPATDRPVRIDWRFSNSRPFDATNAKLGQVVDTDSDADQHETKIQQRTDIGDTQKQRLVNARRGQGIFKDNLQLFEKQCRVTHVTDPTLLIASHIKPWIVSSDVEKLDGHNGLLLAPHVDKLFDRGLISFSDKGALLTSSALDLSVHQAWGISTDSNVGAFGATQCGYLEYHRTRVFNE